MASASGPRRAPPLATQNRVGALPPFFMPARLWVPLAFLGLITLAVVLAPVLASHDPTEMSPSAALRAPGGEHLLGTDEFGRDLLSRLLYGGRTSLTVATGSIAVASCLGVSSGLFGAYYGGMAEAVIMRSVDVLLSIPPILLAIAIVALLGSSVINLMMVIGLLYTPQFARVTYASALSVKQREFVEAARAVGSSNLRIIRKAILPNTMAPIIVQTSISLGYAILLESGLSFLGLGAPPPAPSWGAMIASGRGYMQITPWPVLWPALVVWAVILAFNRLGDALRDTLDPRLTR